MMRPERGWTRPRLHRTSRSPEDGDRFVLEVEETWPWPRRWDPPAVDRWHWTVAELQRGRADFPASPASSLVTLASGYAATLVEARAAADASYREITRDRKGEGP